MPRWAWDRSLRLLILFNTNLMGYGAGGTPRAPLEMMSLYFSR